MKFLVPTDFSDCAAIAARYAIVLAKQARAGIFFLHVSPQLGPSLGSHSTEQLRAELLEAETGDLRKFISGLDTNGVQVSSGITFGGSVKQGIEGYDGLTATDLVVMGSHGASGARKVLLGSNTVDVINDVGVPVLVVPPKTEITPVTEILYASDLRHLHLEFVTVVDLAKKLKTAIRILHLPPPQYHDVLDTEKIAGELRQETGFQDISIDLLNGDNVQASVEKNAARSGALLVMFTHHAKLLDQLFSKSICREIVWHGQVPILVFNTRS